MKSLNISESSFNRCFGQGIHELTEIARDFRKSLKLLAKSYAFTACKAGNVCNGSIGQIVLTRFD